eukprot:365861-Chlamydomonas_euryale.AAC.43
MSGRGVAQSSRLRQVLGASKQDAEAHQSSKAPVDAEGWDKAHLVAKALLGGTECKDPALYIVPRLLY